MGWRKLILAAPSMPSNMRFLNPDAIPKPGGYSHVVEITGPGRIVYIAGQLGFGRDGRAGETFDHVVKLNNYLVDIRANIPIFREVRDRYINPASPPASTTIGVPALARADALFEVEAVVMLPR
jgi:enamine deaminase RidA (YjgF/YER057c/UK114 family)